MISPPVYADPGSIALHLRIGDADDYRRLPLKTEE